MSLIKSHESDHAAQQEGLNSRNEFGNPKAQQEEAKSRNEFGKPIRREAMKRHTQRASMSGYQGTHSQSKAGPHLEWNGQLYCLTRGEF